MRTKGKNVKWIRLISGLFLFVLLAEFASHGAICAVVVHNTAAEINASHHDSEDPCQTLVLCSNNREKERQTASFTHDKVQHNGLIGGFILPPVEAAGSDPSNFVFPETRPRFRPPDLLFRPPELS
ncbi:MAG: hypothetical protein KF756_02130 [Acidobacteria bacterium]|nr:hypothetical protein [Acidobacteriota bacterium]